MITDSRLLEALWELKRGFAPRCGICSSLVDDLGLKGGSQVTFIRLQLHPLFLDWPEFSGEPEYPVSHPQHPGDVDEADWAYWNLPRWSGEYGGARIRLLNFLIRTLEQRIKDAV